MFGLMIVSKKRFIEDTAKAIAAGYRSGWEMRGVEERNREYCLKYGVQPCSFVEKQAEAILRVKEEKEGEL